MAKIKEKDLKEAFSKDTKAVEIVNNSLGAAYILISIADMFVETATDQLKKYNLEFRDIKYNHNRMERAFNDLHLNYKTMFPTKEDEKRFSIDCLEYYDKIVEMFNLKDLLE